LASKADYLARVQEDGSGLTRIVKTKVVEIGGASPDGKWVSIAGVESEHGNFIVGVADGSKRKICAGACFARWSADGKYMYVTTNASTYVVPIPRGVGAVDWPANGIDVASHEELARFQLIPQSQMSPGPDPQTYAYATAAFQGNLFRIPLH